MNQERFELGVQLFNAVHGDGSAQDTIKALERVSPELAKFSVEWIFADLYRDKTLDYKTRELLNLAALTVSGDEPQIKNHIHAAINVGCTQVEIRSALLQMLIIAGFPKVVNAMLILDQVLTEKSK